ncbi:hypothetical protein PSP6_160206 [Paraburkholderia tropica]|nr:hypothetical protein PSP6_160206 [Paraburkholderia tropica]
MLWRRYAHKTGQIALRGTETERTINCN